MYKRIKVKVRHDYPDMLVEKVHNKHTAGANIDFWQKIDDLQNAYPEVSITVELFLVSELGGFYEMAAILCDEAKTKDIAEQILHQLYTLVPVCLRSELEEKGEEEIRRLLKLRNL